MPERILVCGYYGFGNSGDEAILSVLLEDLHSVYPEAVVTVSGGSPAAVRSDHGVEAIDWLDIPALIGAAREADLMVLGGGGLFQDHQGFDPTTMLTRHHGGIGYYGGFALLATLVETPLAIYGVGVGPLSSEEGRRFTRLAFEQASAVSVRDEASRQLLDDAGYRGDVPVAADPAWSLEAAPSGILEGILRLENAPAADRTIGVAVRPWGDGEWARPLAAALDELIEDLDARVLFVPLQESPHRHENDSHAAVEVIRSMDRTERVVNLRGGYTAAERKTILGACDLVFGMRLHAVIYAASLQTRIVALSYDPKVAATMGALGLPELVVDLGEATRERLTGAAHRALDAPPPAEAAVQVLRNRASANRAVLIDARNRPRPERDDATVDALLSLAFTRIEEHGELQQALARTQHDRSMLERSFRSLESDRDALHASRAEILDSRSYRLIANYWRARDGIRRAAAAGAKRLPTSVRPALRRLAASAPPDPAGQAHAHLRPEIEEQLGEILETHREAPGIVVYPPTIGWDVSLFQRPQQMALAFARLGYLVLYGLEHYNKENVVGFRREAPRLYLAAIPPVMSDLLKTIPDPISITYVYNYAWTDHLDNPKVVFEHIDELEVFTAVHSLKDLDTWYREAVTGADVAVASAADLLDKMRRDRPDAVLSPNGVDYRHFAEYRPGPPPEDIADIADRTIVGYYGAIAEWVDYDLIRRAAVGLTDFEFVFLGPDYDGSMKAHRDVFELPNVRWLGVKGYDELPAYLHYFDVATIPFLVNEVTHAVSPLKLFEYMAGGRPIVTPALRECARYEAVMVADDADGYPARLREAADRADDPDYRALLRRTARANTWEMRAGTLIDALARAHR